MALDDQLRAWRNRQLGAYFHVFLDTSSENVRNGGLNIQVSSSSLSGLTGAANEMFSVSLSEQEVHWSQPTNSEPENFHYQLKQKHQQMGQAQCV